MPNQPANDAATIADLIKSYGEVMQHIGQLAGTWHGRHADKFRRQAEEQLAEIIAAIEQLAGRNQ